MSRLYKGMVIRTSYNSGSYVVIDYTEDCTCPSFMDSITLLDKAPKSRPHYHLTCIKYGECGHYYLNGYDENLNSVWGNDRLIDCAEETLFLTLCCSLWVCILELTGTIRLRYFLL